MHQRPMGLHIVENSFIYLSAVRNKSDFTRCRNQKQEPNSYSLSIWVH